MASVTYMINNTFSLDILVSLAKAAGFSRFERQRVKQTLKDHRQAAITSFEFSFTEAMMYVYFNIDGKRMRVGGARDQDNMGAVATILLDTAGLFEEDVVPTLENGASGRSIETMKDAQAVLEAGLKKSNVRVYLEQGQVTFGQQTLTW